MFEDIKTNKYGQSWLVVGDIAYDFVFSPIGIWQATYKLIDDGKRWQIVKSEVQWL